MAKVTGLGGVFFRSRDPQALGEWYEKHLGFSMTHGFASFLWRDDPDKEAQSLWVPFEADTDHFGSQTQQAMFNFRVDDLDALVKNLEAAGVPVEPDRPADENGKFAWITDPDGNRVELWEPVRQA